MGVIKGMTDVRSPFPCKNTTGHLTIFSGGLGGEWGDKVRCQECKREGQEDKTEVEEERGPGMGQGPKLLGVLTMLYVLPQDPVFGIIFKSHQAALLRTTDLGHGEGGVT